MEGEEQNDDYDSPWKDAITRYLPDFMGFYFPDAHAEIDWSRPHRFLDQELAQEKNMPYVTSVERIGLRRGLDQGRKEGLESGRKEGRQEGEAIVLLRQIELKFGPPDAAARKRVKSADSDTLLRWYERIHRPES